MRHVPRPRSRNVGGVALLYKSAISFRLHGSSTAGDYTNFKHMDCDLNTGDTTVRLAVVYRPPTSKYNGLTLPEFFDQWSTFLAGYATLDKEIPIVGDLNVHVNVVVDPDAQ